MPNPNTPATPATARTSAAVLTPDTVRFLKALPADGRVVTSKALPHVADRAQDRARQSCRRNGYAQTGPNERGRAGWQITNAGRSALAALEG